MASSSSSSYDVFINFRGPDTREKFVRPLYNALEGANISTYVDREELQKGEKIEPVLVRAIQNSKISIPVFSKNYAHSKFCLLELAQIWKCQLSDCQIVIPIFIDVEPRDVRHQTECFQQPFEKYQRNREPAINSWRNALTEVGNLSGWTLKGDADPEEQLDTINSVVKRVLQELHRTPLDERRHIVGIDSHVNEVIRLLHIGSDDVQFVGIGGMAGLGKTTIAEVVRDRIGRDFRRCCFLRDINQKASEGNAGLVFLQEKLLQDILNRKYKISDTSDGESYISQNLREKNILLILDSVEEEQQLLALAGELNWFGPGSKVLITTKDKHILNVHGSKIGKDIPIYEPEEMNLQNALHLFSLHAFSKIAPPEKYWQLSCDMVDYAGGLPLTLEVLGSFLVDKNDEEWEETLERLKDIKKSIKSYDDKVFARLMISYSKLGAPEKTIFLDIACHFSGWEKETPISIWKACDFQPGLALKELKQKHLLKIDDNGALRMHDQLCYLGRRIALNDSPEEPTKHIRLWSQDEIWKVLKNDTETKMVEGMLIQHFQVKVGDKFEVETVLSCEAFQKMPNLRFLEFHRITSFNGDFSHLPSKLRWFRWRGLGILPPDFYHPELVHLDLSFEFVRQSWDDPTQNKKKRFQKLKVLNLHDYREVSFPPDFLLRFPCLQRLNLYKCFSLSKLPDSICQLASLKTITISGSWSFRKLPTSIGHLKDLVELCLHNTRIQELPDGVGQLEKLEKLVVSNEPEEYPELLKLPASMGRMKSLQHFNLIGYQIKKLPDDFSKLLSLEVFIMGIRSWQCIDKCFSFESLPELPSTLTHLEVKDCISLLKIPVQSHLERLEELSLCNCKSLVELPDLTNLRRLRKLDISSCENLEEIPSLEGTESLEELDAQWCHKLRELPDFSKLKRLRKLEISDCENLEKIHGLEGTESLEELGASNCHKLTELPDLSKLKRLRKLNISSCKNLEEIPSLEGTESLESLYTISCNKLRELPDLSKLKRLSTLSIGFCKNIEKIPGLEETESLEVLSTLFCSKLKELPDLSKLKRLAKLDIKCCKNLEEIHGLTGSFEELDLSNLERLRKLSIGCDENLEKNHCLQGTGSSEELDASSCYKLRELSDLSKVKRLRKLNLRCCENLEEIHGLDGRKFLTELDASNCYKITETTRKIHGQGTLVHPPKKALVDRFERVQGINGSPILCVVFAFTDDGLAHWRAGTLGTISLEINAAIRRGEIRTKCLHSIRLEDIKFTTQDIIYIHHFKGFDWFGFPLESKDAIDHVYVTIPKIPGRLAEYFIFDSICDVKLVKILFENKESKQHMPNQQSSSKLVAEFFRWSTADDAEEVEEKGAFRASNDEGGCLDEDDNEDDEDTEEAEEAKYSSEDTEEAEEEASPFEDIEEEEERNNTTADSVSEEVWEGFYSVFEEVWEEEEKLTPSNRSYFHYNNDEEMPIQQPNIDDEVPGIPSDIEEAEVVRKEDETKAGMQFLCRPVKAVWDCFCNCFTPGFSR